MSKIKGFHLPTIEPGTAIHITQENGGGWLVSCPECNLLRFAESRILVLGKNTLSNNPSATLLDSIVDFQCPQCGAVWGIVGNQIRVTTSAADAMQLRQRKPLAVYGRAA